jgi:hypothetical protein
MFYPVQGLKAQIFGSPGISFRCGVILGIEAFRDCRDGFCEALSFRVTEKFGKMAETGLYLHPFQRGISSAG